MNEELYDAPYFAPKSEVPHIPAGLLAMLAGMFANAGGSLQGSAVGANLEDLLERARCEDSPCADGPVNCAEMPAPTIENVAYNSSTPEAIDSMHGMLDECWRSVYALEDRLAPYLTEEAPNELAQTPIPSREGMSPTTSSLWDLIECVNRLSMKVQSIENRVN